MNATYTVTRDCCTSGNCVTCIGRSPVGKSIRVVQQAHLTEARAKRVADGWARYGARVESDAE